MAAKIAISRPRWTALLVLCLSDLMIMLDATIVNVALPSIRHDLAFSQGGLAWVVDGYLIPFGGLLLPAGRLGDLIGKRRVYLIGLVLFTAASTLCACAWSQSVLITARFAQGIGGALTTAVILGMIVSLFPEPEEQGKAIGVYGFITAAGGAVGLVLGGVLTTANWHWIFLINAPVGLLALWLSTRYVATQPGTGLARGADVTGGVLLTCGLMLAVYAVLGIGNAGWLAPSTLGTAAVAIGLVTVFLVRQAKSASPLLPLRLFRYRSVNMANVIQLLMVTGMFGVFYFGAQYLQEVLGLSPLEVGLSFLPAALTMAFTALLLSALCIRRLGQGTTLLSGLCSLELCLLLLAHAPANGTYAVNVLPALVLFGLGGGLSFPALMGMAMSGLPESDSGVASGLLSTTYQVGGAMGVAVLTSVAAAKTDGRLAPQALAEGFRTSYAVAAIVVAVAILISATALSALRPKRDLTQAREDTPMRTG
jgi:EmrB/QacA subfamily drug resistance transporter